MPPTRKTSLEKKLANATVTPDEIYKYLTIDKGLSHEHAMGMLPNAAMQFTIPKRNK